MESYRETNHEVHMRSQQSNEQFDMMAIPLGYRFLPTDEELISHYLTRKVLGLHVPPNPCKEVDRYNYTPQQLEVKYGTRREKEMYFFNINKLKYVNGNRPSREARDGFWRASTPKITIKDQNGLEIGYKMLLNYRSNIDKNKNTDWLMYEYTTSDSKKIDEYVLCKVYSKGNKQVLQVNTQPEEPHQNRELQLQLDHTANLYHQNVAQVTQNSPDCLQSHVPANDCLKLESSSFHETKCFPDVDLSSLLEGFQADYQSITQKLSTLDGIFGSVGPYNQNMDIEDYQNMDIRMQQTHPDFLQQRHTTYEFASIGLENQIMELENQENEAWQSASEYINMELETEENDVEAEENIPYLT